MTNLTAEITAPKMLEVSIIKVGSTNDMWAVAAGAHFPGGRGKLISDDDCDMMIDRDNEPRMMEFMRAERIAYTIERSNVPTSAWGCVSRYQ